VRSADVGARDRAQQDAVAHNREQADPAFDEHDRGARHMVIRVEDDGIADHQRRDREGGQVSTPRDEALERSVQRSAGLDDLVDVRQRRAQDVSF
jgi:hypothetical protein